MANMTFKANLLPNTDLGYSLGSSNLRWKINNITISSGTQNVLIKYGNNSIGDSSIVDVGNISYHTVTPDYTSGGQQFYEAWLAYVASHFTNGALHIGTINPNSKGPILGNIYSVDLVDETTGLPQYSTFLFHNLGGDLESFGTHNYTYYHRNYLSDHNYSTYLDGSYVTLSTAQTITEAKTFTQPIYFETGPNTSRAILGYNASYPNHGITYTEGNPDVMTFSASGNANNTTNADLSINGLGDGKVSIRGNEILHIGNYAATLDPRYVNVTGDTMTGNLSFSDANIGIRRVGRSTSWIGGRDGALLRTTSINGYSPAISIKTTSGSWEIGAYNYTGFQECLVLSYATDANYSASNNSTLNRVIRSDGTSNLIVDRAITADYPTGFTGRFTGANWGNQTGTTVTGWSTSTSGAIEFRNDNPSSGKLSVKVDGRFYGNEGTYPAMLMNNTNSYWGMGDPDAASNVWIRTTSQGILPYQSGGAGSGHCGLGTSSWYFSYCYVDNDYAVHQRSSGRAYMGEWIEFSAAANGLYWPNSVGGTHFYPNNATTYGGFIMQGTKGGYMGITMGNANTYMTVMSSGLHNGLYHESKGRWSFYYNRDNDQVGIFSSNCASGFNITLNGSTYITSTLRAAGEIQSTSANAFRLVYGNYGLMFRNDGSNSYLLVTASGDQYGSWTSARPLTINNSTGVCSINGNAATATKATQDQNGLNIASGYLKLGGGTMTGQIQKASTGVSWVNGRSGALIRNTAATYTSNSYNPIVSVKSINGTWDIGTYTANNSLYFTYITDTNFNAGTNTTTAQIEFRGSDNSIRASKVYGAVWNDYAEYRETKEIIESGRCVCEVGDDTMVLTTARLQKGCKIISDTFGFSIGETETAKTPIAVSGRALVYLYEDREEAKNHIGDFVCSGPNGTVSIMTTEEYFKCPQAVVGTISAIPDYEEWGTGKVKVNNRIWIYVK